MDTHLILVLAIIFLATLIASTFGFGIGLVAMPLLALILDIKTATPLVAMVTATTAFFIFIKSWRQVNLIHIWKLVAASIAGIPIGLYVLKGTGDNLMKGILALMIILFAVYSLYGRINLHLKTEKSSIFFGLFSGIVGSAYNMGGPPVIVYGALRNWSPTTFRATIFCYYLPLSIFTVMSHVLAGLVTVNVVKYYGYSLPIIAFTAVIGGVLNRSIPTDHFIRYIYIFLLLIGSFLLFKTLR